MSCFVSEAAVARRCSNALMQGGVVVQKYRDAQGVDGGVAVMWCGGVVVRLGVGAVVR
jgi:hypothetical protein